MRRSETLRAALARQHALESESVELGADRYQRARPMPWQTSVPAAGEEARMAPGKALIAKVVAPLSAAIKEFTDRIANGRAGHRPAAAKLLSMVDPEAAAWLSLRIATNALLTGSTVQAMASQIGTALVDHVEMTQFTAEQPESAKGLDRLTKTAPTILAIRRYFLMQIVHRETRLDLSDQDRKHAGLKMLDLVCQTTGWFDLVSRPRCIELVAKPALREWLKNQHDRRSLLSPLDLPMLVPPKPWRSSTNGGYRVRQTDLVKTRERRPARLTPADCPTVFDAINSVQSTPWRINQSLLSVFEDVWTNGGTLGGLPETDNRTVPDYPDAAKHDPAIDRKWRDQAVVIHRHNLRQIPAKLRVHQLLWLTKKFGREDAIWFPHALDWRGRAYPIASTAGPHPQGPDLNRALLEFAEGKPLGHDGADWLAIHVAGVFGHDKASLDERLAWTKANSTDIAACAADPFDHRWWTTTAKPWTTLAACMAWAGYLANGPAYVCHLPIPNDATSSGLQHFSALLRDEVGGAAVNLIPADEPQDVYARVAALAATKTTDPRLFGKITRPLTKQPTMTFVYAATRHGALCQIRSTIQEIETTNPEAGPYVEGLTPHQAAMVMTPLIWDAIGETVIAARTGMDWLKAVSRLFDGPIRWTTPAGFPVLHRYDKADSYLLKVYVGPQRRTVQIRFATDAPVPVHDRAATAKAIAANLIHSLDASHMMLTASACRRAGLALSVVHDSFATHAADLTSLRDILRRTFVEQYTPDVLANLRDQFIAQLPATKHGEMPALPGYGTLEINTVLSSQYLFN